MEVALLAERRVRGRDGQRISHAIIMTDALNLRGEASTLYGAVECCTDRGRA